MAKAHVGDLIRLVVVDTENVGKITEVTRVDETHAYVKDCGTLQGVKHGNYTIHRKAGEEDASICANCGKQGVHTCRGTEYHAKQTQDAVNQPSHYTQGRFETIEIIEEITQGYSDGYVAYCVGNALKYLARAPFKHGEPSEDIGKAAKYIEFALARLQTQK